MCGINWEKSKATTLLKRDLLKEFFSINKSFFLTGGSALGMFYLDHRKSYDLDLFSITDIDWHLLSNEFLYLCNKIKARVNLITATPTFRRYSVQRNEDTEIIDFVREMAVQVCAQKNIFGDIIVDVPMEIAINKWCALFGRSELKDIIDLYFLQGKIDIWDAYDKVLQKEGGIDPSMLSYLLSQVKINELPEYLLSELSLNDLDQFIKTVLSFLNKKSFPEQE
jgi:hypothetical protein